MGTKESPVHLCSVPSDSEGQTFHRVVVPGIDRDIRIEIVAKPSAETNTVDEKKNNACACSCHVDVEPPISNGVTEIETSKAETHLGEKWEDEKRWKDEELKLARDKFEFDKQMMELKLNMEKEKMNKEFELETYRIDRETFRLDRETDLKLKVARLQYSH